MAVQIGFTVLVKNDFCTLLKWLSGSGVFIAGVACRNLIGKEVYPMLCSTAARSGMRLVRTQSCTSTLQYLCCRKLRQVTLHYPRLLISEKECLRSNEITNTTFVVAQS